MVVHYPLKLIDLSVLADTTYGLQAAMFTSDIGSALRAARALRAPVVVHVRTVKGKGYEPAESDPVDRLHAVPPAFWGDGGANDEVG